MKTLRPKNPQITPLKKSIEHWKRMVAAVKKDGFEGLDKIKEYPTGSDCACCKAFFDTDKDEPCSGCPIFEKTGKGYCENTPYHQANDSYYYKEKSAFVLHGKRMISFMQRILTKLEKS